ncbi:MAG: SDR family oxidoreductase [Sneathiellaceae bacterium]
MSQPFDLSGKVAIVTGGASGIGLGMAEALGRAGARIAIWDRNEESCAAARARLADLGDAVDMAVVDVTDQAAVQEAFAALLASHGRVDTVVAAAGIVGALVPFAEFDLAEWRRVQAVNVEGAVTVFQQAARHMIARAAAGDPGGSLVGIASIAALSGTPARPAYAASKAAMVSLIKSLAVELARHKVRANAIAPGFIATAMTAGMAERGSLLETKLLPRVPMRRWGQPEDFAGLALYLASDLSGYHTGDTFLMDGGYSAVM